MRVPLLSYSTISYGCWPFRKKIASRLYLLHTVVGSGAMNKFRICLQWRNEHFNLGMLLLSVIGKGAMSAPRYRQHHSELLRIFWHWRNELLRDVGNCAMMPVAGMALLRQVRIYWRLYKKDGETQLSF